jgi:hypothetical protein
MRKDKLIWETPRNIIILLVVTAILMTVITGSIGYWIGKSSTFILIKLPTNL